MNRLKPSFKLFIFSFLFLCAAFQSYAQAPSDKEVVEKIIRDLFDAMREGDSAKARNLFMPDATLGRAAYDKEGTPRVRLGNSIDGWIKAMGTPHDEVWDERIYNLHVSVDPPLANAWMDFKFYVGEKFSHCGVNNFMLFKSSDGWKILGIIDTNRKTDCVED